MGGQPLASWFSFFFESTQKLLTVVYGCFCYSCPTKIRLLNIIIRLESGADVQGRHD